MQQMPQQTGSQAINPTVLTGVYTLTEEPELEAEENTTMWALALPANTEVVSAPSSRLEWEGVPVAFAKDEIWQHGITNSNFTNCNHSIKKQHTQRLKEGDIWWWRNRVEHCAKDVFVGLKKKQKVGHSNQCLNWMDLVTVRYREFCSESIVTIPPLRPVKGAEYERKMRRGKTHRIGWEVQKRRVNAKVIEKVNVVDGSCVCMHAYIVYSLAECKNGRKEPAIIGNRGKYYYEMCGMYKWARSPHHHPANAIISAHQLDWKQFHCGCGKKDHLFTDNLLLCIYCILNVDRAHNWPVRFFQHQFSLDFDAKIN